MEDVQYFGGLLSVLWKMFSAVEDTVSAVEDIKDAESVRCLSKDLNKLKTTYRFPLSTKLWDIIVSKC